jgi:hypothetical protein
MPLQDYGPPHGRRHPVGQPGAGHDTQDAQVVQLPGQPLARVVRVQRHVRRPRREHAEQRDRQVQTAPEQHADQAAGGGALREPRRERARASLELGVRQLVAAEADRDARPRVARRACQRVRDRALVVHG